MFWMNLIVTSHRDVTGTGTKVSKGGKHPQIIWLHFSYWATVIIQLVLWLPFCFFLRILDCLSFQVTTSYFSEEWRKKHQPVIQLCFRSVNDDSSRHPTLFSVLPRAPLRFGSIAKVPSSQVPVLFSDYCLYMHTQYIYIYVYIHIQLSLALYHLCSMSASVET